MYWGNPGIPCTDSEKMDVLYDELKHCKEISMGPNFVVSFFRNMDLSLDTRVLTLFPRYLRQVRYVSIANMY